MKKYLTNFLKLQEETNVIIDTFLEKILKFCENNVTNSYIKTVKEININTINKLIFESYTCIRVSLEKETDFFNNIDLFESKCNKYSSVFQDCNLIRLDLELKLKELSELKEKIENNIDTMDVIFN